MKVMVLATLHQLHGQVDFYTFEDLTRILKRFSPEVLAVELTPQELKDRRPQPVKQEYPRSVYPLLDALPWEVVPLEPEEPLYSELVALGRRAVENLQRRSPDTLEHFGLYVNTLYQVLLRWWRSPAEVNSAETDRHMEIKHGYQSALFGDDEKTGWERWNQHFLDRILEATARHPQGRMLVLVGVEHAYWLRQHLREQEGVALMDTPSVLAEIQGD